MATIRPARTYWDAVATSWCYFNAGVTTAIFHNTSTLVFGTNNSNPAVETWRSAIQFDTNSAPSWTSDGPISGSKRALLIVLSQIARRAGGLAGIVEIAQINAAWDDTYTAAQMRALSLSAWSPLSDVVSAYGVPEAWNFGFGTGTAYGYMLRVQPGDAAKGGVIRCLTDPAPIMRHLYQYSPTTAERIDATERVTLSSKDLAVIAGYGECKYFEQVVTIKRADRRPILSNIDLGIVRGTSIAALNRNLEWPESWTADIPATGGIPFSQVSNTDMADIEGVVSESLLHLVHPSGETTEISKIQQYIGDITYSNNGTGEVELRSMLDRVFRSTINNYSLYGSSSVDYTDEFWIYIIIDLIMNCSGVLYNQLHYNNLPYLLRRFAGVFGTFSYSSSDLTDVTIADIISDICPILSLCVSQTATGCIALWHPAVYRKSMRVWTIDEGDCKPGQYFVTKRGRDKQYGYARITDTDNGTGWNSQYLQFKPARTPRRAGQRNAGEFFEVQYSNTASPSTTNAFTPTQLPSAPGINENPYEFTAKGQVFIDYGSARAAIGRQFAERLCSEYWVCDLSLGLKGLPIDIGDVVKLTGSYLIAQTNFLVISVSTDLSLGEARITGVHYPEALALSNTFENDGIEGEWRWLDETGSQDVTNQSPSGSDSNPNTTTLATLSYEHWQGVMHSAGYTEWTSTPLISTSLHDIIDVCTMIAPEIDGNVANITSWGDDTYMPIMVWRKAAGNEAFAVGFYRPGYGGGTDDIVTNQVFIGHITDYTAASFSFTTGADLSANGICGRETGTTAVPAAFALQWDDSGNVNVYIDRQLVVSSRSAYSKSGWNQVRIMTQTDIKIGCVRHIQTDTEVTELQRLQGLNGLDPYQP